MTVKSRVNNRRDMKFYDSQRQTVSGQKKKRWKRHKVKIAILSGFILRSKSAQFFFFLTFASNFLLSKTLQPEPKIREHTDTNSYPLNVSKAWTGQGRYRH